MERFFNSKLMVGLQRAGQGLGNNKFMVDCKFNPNFLTNWSA
ncbi:PTS system, cellobiose-specific IIC component [Lactiplantibacillus plantarum]|nr:PTS system, cellobiose-specific IIC component [Lactiplantibacillus plantarum]